MQTTYYAILPDREGQRMLLLRQEHGYSLPHWAPADGEDPPLSAFLAAIQAQTGIPVAPLREVYSHYEEGCGQILYEMENRSLPESPSALPGEGAVWAGQEDLPGLEIVPPEHKAVLEDWFAQVRQLAPPALRNPWARPGWLDAASAWIAEQLRHLDRAPAGPVEPFQIGCLSAVLRVPTTAGDVFFKAALALFAVEPKITQWLSARYPGRVPAVLAIDPERIWMLMGAFGGTKLGETPALEAWEQALRLMARIQVEAVTHVADLQEMGCPDRRLARLADQFESLLADRDMLQKIPKKGLSNEEVAAIEDMAPSVRALSERLSAFGIPETLIHGDLHPWNIQVQDGDPLIYDWTDAAFAHPFLDLLPFFERRPKEEPAAVYERLRNAYLDAWSAYGRPEVLAEAFEIARILASFYQAVSYAAIAANLEPAEQHGVSGAVPGYLRRLLEDRNRLMETLSSAGTLL